MNWREFAACSGQDGKLFFTNVTSRVQKAKAICATCGVSAECLSFALDCNDFEDVIYGGFTGIERKAMV